MRRILPIIVLIVFIVITITVGICMYRMYYSNQLFNAIQNNDFDTVKRAISCGADVNRTKYPETSKWGGVFHKNPTVLMQACSEGNIEMVQLLLDCGADINKLDPWTGASALEEALIGNDAERYSLAMFLIDQGADIQVSSGTYSPIARSLGIFEEDPKETIDQGYALFRYLLENGASREMPSKSNMLTFASSFGNIQAVEYLIDAGVFSINDQDAKGRTALIAAVEGEWRDLCKLLVEKGADPEIKDIEGRSAIDYAVQQKNNEILDILQNG